MPESQLVRKARLVSSIVFVDGIARSGKSLLGPLLASFDRVELERMEEIFEFIATLDRLGKIERDAAVTTLQLRADAFLYAGLLGRNMNLRFGDHSSVWQHTQRLGFLRRLRATEGLGIVDRVASEKPIFQTMSHDQLANFHLYREAFGKDLRFVEMVRNPFGQFQSWMSRDWGTRFQTDPLSFTFMFDIGDTQVPYYAAGWEQEYLDASPEGRIIRMIYQIWNDVQSTYDGLSSDEKAQVHYVIYDEFISNPNPYMESLAAFLGTKTTRHTKTILKRKNLPVNRIVDIDRIKRTIAANASAEEVEMIDRLESEYQQLLQTHVLR